jgi:RimJ/RimL family protein N-acetyltransferase
MAGGEFMNHDLYQGRLVRLKAVDIESMAAAYYRWSQDSEYWRLASSEPAQPFSIKATKDWLEEKLYKDPPEFIMFAIHILEDDRLIGDIGFENEDMPDGELAVGIGIGEQADWGKGYGTEAMRLILHYAFNELNLQRVTLTVSEYNPRAIQSYLKAGFVEEGRLRGSELRAGHRYDLVSMGILREDWEQTEQEAEHA